VVFSLFCRSKLLLAISSEPKKSQAELAPTSDEVSFQNVVSETIFQPEFPFFRRRDLLVDTEKFEDLYS